MFYVLTHEGFQNTDNLENVDFAEIRAVGVSGFNAEDEDALEEMAEVAALLCSLMAAKRGSAEVSQKPDPKTGLIKSVTIWSPEQARESVAKAKRFAHAWAQAEKVQVTA